LTDLFQGETLSLRDKQINVKPPENKHAEEDHQDERTNSCGNTRGEEGQQEVPDPIKV
jgi:hypothetical protein